MTVMVEVCGVSKNYGKTRALDRVDLGAEAGAVLALIGPNGAGKTTLIKILSTLLRPDEGRAAVAGYDVVADGASVRRQIGFAGQFAAVDELLTGRENLELVGIWYHLSRKESRRRAEQVLELFSLRDVANDLVKTYSGGMRRRLDIGASLIGSPPVVFLDEPTTGMDPRTRNDMWGFIRTELLDHGTCVVLSTQYMEEAERLADRVVVMDHGHRVAEGTIADLQREFGGKAIEMKLWSGADRDKAIAVLQELGFANIRRRDDERRVTVPANRGIEDLVAIGNECESRGVVFEDLAIRHPSLDDIFLSLTTNEPRVEFADAEAARPMAAGGVRQ